MHPTRPGEWAASALDGAVWLTTDAGVSWAEVLRPLPAQVSGDERILLDVEARLSDLAGDLDAGQVLDGFDEDELDVQDELASEAESAVGDAVDAVQSELEADPWFLEHQAALQGRVDAARPRVWYTAGGVLLAGRADGLRASADRGASWALVLDVPVTAFAEGAGGAWVAGTIDGPVTSDDARVWSPIVALAGVRVLDLVEDGGLYITTSDGLWHVGDTGRATALRVGVEGLLTARPVAGAPPSSGTPRSVALGAVDTLRFTPRVFDRAIEAAGGPAPEVHDIERPSADRMWAASAAGPFESLDGGQTWTVIDRGLGDPGALGVAAVGDLVLLASAGGLYQLRPVPDDVRSAERPVEIAPWIPLSALMRTALQRRELTQRLGSRWAAAALPQLTLEYRQIRVGRDDWSTSRGYTVRGLDGYWQIMTRLRWTPNRQRTNSGGFELDADDTSVLVLADEVVVDDGTSLTVLASKVGRGSTSYRSELTDRISRLFTARVRLAANAERGQDRNLLERTERQLRIDEIEAQLDALTDGAVASWRPGPENVDRGGR